MVRLGKVLFLAACCTLLALATAGCVSPGLTEEDLGEVIDYLPDVPGTEKPYKLPEFDAGPPTNPGPEPINPTP